MSIQDADRARLAERMDIRDLYSRYGRAIHRIDEKELRQVFHHDALVDKGAGDIRLEDYVPDIIRRHSPVQRASLQVTNVLIDFLGPHRAFCESWAVEVQQREDPDTGALVDFVFWVRYGDEVQRREDGAWRIARRKLILDHVMALAVQGSQAADFMRNALIGRRSDDDPIVRFRRELNSESLPE